jgi:hypothetical protein
MPWFKSSHRPFDQLLHYDLALDKDHPEVHQLVLIINELALQVSGLTSKLNDLTMRVSRLEK